MLSNLKYHSFKGLDRNRRVPFLAMIITIIVFVVVLINPPRVLFMMAFIYAISGPIFWVAESVFGKSASEKLVK